MILLGAIGGDIAGSRYEFSNYRAKDFDLFSDKDFFTDDTVMTLAIAQALVDTAEAGKLNAGHGDLLRANAEKQMQRFGREFPGRGYGGRFAVWLRSDNPKPYNSFGNGSAMRVSACGWAAKDAQEAENFARLVSEPTHNHPEGIKGAAAASLAVFYARTGMDKKQIGGQMRRFYDLDFTLDEIRPTYQFNETCQETVPQAIVAFLESESYEDALRSAVSVGGDSDTLAAITGAIAEAYYGIPDDMQQKILSYIEGEPELMGALQGFNEMYGR